MFSSEYNLLYPGDCVDECELDERCEDEHGADEEPDVEISHVVYLGQVSAPGALSQCHKGHPSRSTWNVRFKRNQIGKASTLWTCFT